MADGYDIIGDVHGHADKLKALLVELGYRHTRGAFRHPARKAIFVGDLIARGCQNRETISLVRNMHEADEALMVMGNHEYNAICFHTPDPTNDGEYLRPRIQKNIEQHSKFMDELTGQDNELQKTIDWFKELPLFLEEDGLRVIHACWHKKHLPALRQKLPTGLVTNEFLVQSSKKTTEEHTWIENLLKGPEYPLPGETEFKDKDGNTRKEIRTKWWFNKLESYRNSALVGKKHLETIPDDGPMPNKSLVGYPESAPPVFFGHYWLTGDPEPMAPNVACLDYSVGESGKLCAYRWDGKQIIDSSKFVTV